MKLSFDSMCSDSSMGDKMQRVLKRELVCEWQGIVGLLAGESNRVSIVTVGHRCLLLKELAGYEKHARIVRLALLVH